MVRSRLSRQAPYVFFAHAASILILSLAFPLLYMIWGSFRDWDSSQIITETEFIGLQNYARLMRDAAFLESTWVTLKFAFIVVIAEMVIGVGLALALDRKIRGMSVLRTAFILPMMIAPVVVGLIWRYMYHPTVGPINKTLKSWGFDGVNWLSDYPLTSVIISDIWQWSPFIFILSIAALQSLPKSAIEAARVTAPAPGNRYGT